MSSSQTGKTGILNNFAGYIVDRVPGPPPVLRPRVENGKSRSKERLAPMPRGAPCLRGLRGKVPDVRTRGANNTTLHKRFPGGHITTAGADSAAGLAARPIRYVLLDEADRYPASAGAEGNVAPLAIKGAATFWNRKVVMVSSPAVKRLARGGGQPLEEHSLTGNCAIIGESYFFSPLREHPGLSPVPHCSAIFTPTARVIHWAIRQC